MTTFRLASFTAEDRERCRRELRQLTRGAGSLEEVAERVTSYLYDRAMDEKGRRALALVRLFKTHPYHELPPELRSVADKLLGSHEKSPWLKCLTLLGTRGDNEDWNHRTSSRGHQAIPLASEEVVLRAPMVSRLIQQFGLSIASIVGPPEKLRLSSEKTFGIFHIPEAAGSPYLPAQKEFVLPHAIRSVVGFGGLLQTADLWCVIMFSKEQIGADTAEQFKAIASALTVALIPFGKSVFQQKRAG
jgi:hypothetical protein